MRMMLCLALGLTAALAAVPARAAGTADAADLAVCAFIAGIEAPRRLDDYVVAAAIFDLDGDGMAERLTVEDEGTAHFGRYQVVRPDGTVLDVKAADEVAEVDDDWSWMPGQRWLIYEGRAYVLRFAGWGTGYLRYASRIAGDLVEHPLCRFAPQVSVSLAPSRAGDAAVCEAVEHGVVTYAAIDRYADPEPAPGREVPGGTTEVVGEAQVDFDNGGRPVPVYLYSVDSGAGPGCQLRYYDTAPTDAAASPGHAQLTAMQGLDVTDAYPRRTCLDAEPRWFTFDGVTYLQTESTEADAPTSERGEYRYVDMIEQGLPRRVCEASYVHAAPKLTPKEAPSLPRNGEGGPRDSAVGGDGRSSPPAVEDRDPLAAALFARRQRRRPASPPTMLRMVPPPRSGEGWRLIRYRPGPVRNASRPRVTSRRARRTAAGGR